MIGAAKIAAAIMLGVALTATVAVGVVLPAASQSPVSTLDDANTGDPSLAMPEPTIATPVSIGDQDMFLVDDPGALVDFGEQRQNPDGSMPVAIGLAARWGFLDDPAMASLGGRWHLIDSTSGAFAGVWQAFGRRAHGQMWGDFDIARDGQHGALGGKWEADGGVAGGYLAGFWQRMDGRPGGTFWGRWNFTSGRPGGVLNGMWSAIERGKGEFRGMAINAPTTDMLPWDGFVRVSEGGVKLAREVRFEHGGNYSQGGDDLVYRQRERQTLAWQSSTTVNWDGLIVGMLVPNRATKIVFKTEQWSGEFAASELVGMHMRVPVDRMGHEIELRGFLIPPPRRECGEGNTVKVTLGVRWGYLDERPSPDSEMTMPETQDGDFATWNGFVEVSRGGVALKTVLNWEKGGDYRDGKDDFVYPRNNRLTVEWRSSTTDDWDGVVAVACFPVTRGMPLPHVTIHTDQWSHVYSLDELRGLNETYQVDRLGHEVQVVAWVS